MISLDNLVTVEQTASPGHPALHLFRSAESTNGAQRPQFGEGIAAMEALAKKALPNGMTSNGAIVAGRNRVRRKSADLFALGLVVGVPDAGRAVRELRLPFFVLLAWPVRFSGRLALRPARPAE